MVNPNMPQPSDGEAVETDWENMDVRAEENEELDADGAETLTDEEKERRDIHRQRAEGYARNVIDNCDRHASYVAISEEDYAQQIRSSLKQLIAKAAGCLKGEKFAPADSKEEWAMRQLLEAGYEAQEADDIERGMRSRDGERTVANADRVIAGFKGEGWDAHFYPYDPNYDEAAMREDALARLELGAKKVIELSDGAIAEMCDARFRPAEKEEQLSTDEAPEVAEPVVEPVDEASKAAEDLLSATENW